MNGRRSVPWIVSGMFIMLVVFTGVDMIRAEPPPYARLLPSPDSVLWEEGDETTLWLSSNRDEVTLRINGVDLGIGTFRRSLPASDKTLNLGRGEGCLPWAVTGLEVYSIVDSGTDAKRLSVQGTIDRAAQTGDLTVYIRAYPRGADLAALSATALETPPLVRPTGSVFAITVDRTDSSFTNVHLQVGDTSGDWIVEASHNIRFPATSEVRTSGDVGVLPSPATWPPATAEAEDVLLPRGVGLGIIACGEAEDVVLSLHGADGQELTRYLVDVAADPGTTIGEPPRDAGFRTARICLDDASAQPNYLDGGELVGPALGSAAFGLIGTLQSVSLVDSNGADWKYLFAYALSGGAVQLTVSDAGASGLGLDATRVYPVRLEALDDTAVVDDPATPDIDETMTGLRATLDLGVWLDTSTLSPGNDGACV